MEQATQPKAPQPRLPRGREEKGLFDGLDAKLEEGEYHLLADLDGSAGDDGVSAIRLVCEVKNGSGSEEVGDTVRINGMNYEDHKVNGQEVAEEHRVQVENGQEKYVIPFKVTGLDNKPTYYFRTQLKTQDAWIEPKSDPKRRNTANTKKRKAAAAPAPAPAPPAPKPAAAPAAAPVAAPPAAAPPAAASPAVITADVTPAVPSTPTPATPSRDTSNPHAPTTPSPLRRMSNSAAALLDDASVKTGVPKATLTATIAASAVAIGAGILGLIGKNRSR